MACSLWQVASDSLELFISEVVSEPLSSYNG
jgi:hypothetical protein